MCQTLTLDQQQKNKCIQNDDDDDDVWQYHVHVRQYLASTCASHVSLTNYLHSPSLMSILSSDEGIEGVPKSHPAKSSITVQMNRYGISMKGRGAHCK
jgi:hypothetical protein